ncbi:MAG: hypothetical protein P8008_05335 [Gammaproteobacteria bacterium]
MTNKKHRQNPGSTAADVALGVLDGVDGALWGYGFASMSAGD